MNQVVWAEDAGNQKNNVVDSIETFNRTRIETLMNNIIVTCSDLMDTVSEGFNEIHELLSARKDNLMNDYEKVNATVNYRIEQSRKQVTIIL